MQLKQANTLLVAAMVVVALIVLVACYLIYNGISQSDEARQDRDNNFGSFKRTFEKADPFPNEDNIKRMGENIGVMTEGFQSLVTDLGEGVTLAGVSTDAEFGRRREEVLKKLTEAAPIGHSGSRIIPADFMFGFDAYRDGHAAKLEYIPRLLLQLDIIDAVIREMYASDVFAINEVSREVFEGGPVEASSSDEEESGRGRRGRRGRRSGRDDTGDAVSEASSSATGDISDIGVPLNRQKFHFAFDAKESSLVDFLNRLASMPMYIAVTKLSFEKAGEDVASEKPGSDRPSRPARGRFGGRKTAEQQAEPPADAPTGRLARLFSGRNLESPVHVQLDIEVYNIHREAAEATAAESEE